MSAPQPAAIRTPDQRLRVFVSSTLGELAAERAAVSRAIEALHLTPVLFELGARPHPPRELYRAYLAQSDVFIGLYWQRYGWIGPGMEISGLEDELLLSRSMPRLLYVKTPAPDREPRLAAMIERIQDEGSESYRHFADADELDLLVRDDLAVLLSERFLDAAPVGGAPVSTAPPRSLPVAPTSLIGRDADIDEVVDLVDRPDVRLVTITGAGGIGKTRLAVAVGEAVERRSPGQVVFVPLASIDDPELVLPRVAAALGASAEGSRAAFDVVADAIGDRPLLLVLDNLEQVAAVGPRLDELLARCPALVVLGTSRSALRLRAEHEYPVGPLAVPRGDEHLDAATIAACACVELFTERARAVRHDFELTDENAPAIAEICRRLDGLPLAIELAAARVRLLDPGALLARLRTSLDALGKGPVDLPERQRTLRATVEWSLGLLATPERHLLATLSVFVDGWTLDAATAVAGLPEEDALDLLDSLAGSSLVAVEVTDHGARFRMLHSVRELAAEELTARGDRDEVERRHAEHFGAVVAQTDWRGEHHATWADRLNVEEENVRAAIRWFLGHDPRPLPHLFRVLWLFWQMRDRMPEGRAWIDDLMDQLDSFDEQAKVELILTSAITGVEVGDDESALAAARAIDELRSPIEDPFLANSAQLALAWIRPIEGDDEGALRCAVAAYDGYLGQGEESGAAGAAMSAGMLSLNLGRVDDARHWFGEVERLSTTSGNNWLERGTATQLARLALRAGDADEARRQLRRAVEADDPRDISTYTLAFALSAFAELSIVEGDARRAAAAVGAAEGLRTTAGIEVWPSARRWEAEVGALVRESLSRREFDEAVRTGRAYGTPEVVAFVRDGVEPPER